MDGMDGMEQHDDNSTTAGDDGVSRRQALGYGGAVVGGVAASSLLGAGPAAAADSGRHSGSVASRSVSLAQANRILTAGVRFVESRHGSIPPMFLLVVDDCGDEKASRRMDRNSPASVTLVPIKARTAAAFKTATVDLGRTTDPARIASFTTAGFSLLGGGRPIVENGEVIGAIGVGGGSPEQDDEVARAALKGL
jgi:glc operon protein GlcG